MSINVHVQKPGSSDAVALEIAEEILVEELLKQLFNGQHQEYELFPDGSIEPFPLQHSASAAGIKQGHRIQCRAKRHEVRVHIDEERYHSPNITTGVALYVLGKVPPGHQLYREVKGDREDEPVFRDGEVFELVEDEHFHSSDKLFKGFEVFVNTMEKTVHNRLLSFGQVVDLAFNPRPTGSDTEFTVHFRNAAGRRHQGTLAPGQTVKVKNGTIFDVTPTNRS